MTETQRPGSDAMRVRPRVVVVADARPALGGIATFAHMICDDQFLHSRFDMTLLNTTRRAVWRGGALSLPNVTRAVVDVVRVFRAARDADVVHVQTALMPTLPLVRAFVLSLSAHAAGARVLCHVHTGLVNCGPNEDFRPTRLQRWILRRFRFLHALLAVSTAGARGLRRYAPETRVELVSNAVDVDACATPRSDDGPVVVLYAGALAVAKGLLDLLDAARRLRERGVADWRLELVGGPNQRGEREAERVRATFAAHGFGDCLVGPVAPPELARRLRRAGVFVLPSHSEGHPLVLLEAMAAGVPVVATRVGAVGDVVRDGVDGFVVEPRRPSDLANALETLITSPRFRADFGRAARAQVETKYRLDALTKRLASLYEDAVARGRRS